MSVYTIQMERLAIGATFAGKGLPRESLFLRREDFPNAVAGQLFEAVMSAPAPRTAAEMETMADYHIAKLGPNVAPLVSGTDLVNFAQIASDTSPADIQKVYHYLLGRGAQREISQRLDDLRYQPGKEHQPGVLHTGYQALGEAIERRTSQLAFLNKAGDPVSRTLLDQLVARPMPRAQDHPGWYRTETALLAGLMQRPDTMWTIATMVDSQAFIDRLHHDMFQALHDVAGQGYHSATPERLYAQMLKDRSIGMGYVTGENAVPAREMVHIRGLFHGEQYTPAQTLHAAQALISWHHGGRPAHPGTAPQPLHEPAAMSTAGPIHQI